MGDLPSQPPQPLRDRTRSSRSCLAFSPLCHGPLAVSCGDAADVDESRAGVGGGGQVEVDVSAPICRAVSHRSPCRRRQRCSGGLSCGRLSPRSVQTRGRVSRRDDGDAVEADQREH